MNTQKDTDYLPELITEKLRLRPVINDDAKDIYIYASNPDVTRFVAWEAHTSMEFTRKYLAFIIREYKKKKLYDWGICLKKENRVIGSCGFARIDKRNNFGEIGFVLSPEYWNKGITTEAVKEVVKFGFCKLKLGRIEAVCMAENTASEKVLQKSGMTYEGTLKNRIRKREKYFDAKLFAARNPSV